GEAFRGPFARGVYAHLGAVVREARGVVERIDGTEGELDVALGVNVVQDFERHFTDVLHIHVLIDNENALGRHRLTQTPDAAHHLAGLPGIGLADGDDHQVVKDAFDGHVDVDQFGDGEAHQR